MSYGRSAHSPGPHWLRGWLTKSPPYTWMAPVKRSRGLVTPWMVSSPSITTSPVTSCLPPDSVSCRRAGPMQRSRHLVGFGHRPLEHVVDGAPRFGLGPCLPTVGEELVDVEHATSLAPAGHAVCTDLRSQAGPRSCSIRRVNRQPCCN